LRERGDSGQPPPRSGVNVDAMLQALNTEQVDYLLTTEHGALDVFREVRGLEGRYRDCREAAVGSQTAAGVGFTGMSDAHMLACQEALPEPQRKPRRLATLRAALRRESNA
jgi:hypothetical protein